MGRTNCLWTAVIRKPWRSSSRAMSPWRKTRYASTCRPKESAALRHTAWTRGSAAERRVIEDEQVPADPAQLRECLSPVGDVHQHSKAHDRVERAIRVGQRVRIAFRELYGEPRVGCAGARDAQHFGRRIDAGHPCTPACQCQRGSSSARGHIQHPPAGHVPKECREHSFLVGEQDLPDGPAKTLGVEARRHRGIGVRRVAVVIFAFRKKRV